MGAVAVAQDRGHSTVLPEHFLVAALTDDLVAAALHRAGGSAAAAIDACIERLDSVVAASDGRRLALCAPLERALAGAVREDRLISLSAVLAQLKQLASQVQGARVSFDLADLRGYAYYSGARFAIYVPGASDALVRGGRYDEVGAVFGRNRPAAGFSLDLRELVAVAPARALRAAIRAPWSDTPVLRQAIAQLRAQGETVVCVLPGAASEIDEFLCDRELVNLAGQWTVQPI